RIERALRAEVPIRRLFEHPTVESLTRFIETSTARPERLSQIASIVLKVKALSPTDISHMLELREDEIS
ncbi:hypothetical protein, partial [Nonomuraea sp. LPB2021202275-12-8]|uniref:hypothetical protein n=1 Tax=Nonomuraea sp. LPB2021202275-12-8 TaxID=3120159 RepID=UPI00300DA035